MKGIFIRILNCYFDDKYEYDKMSQASNPYGDGFATSKRIADLLENR